MYKTIISAKNENNIIFLQCYCGNEIISVYYYTPTTTCPEIIALDYFGSVNKKLHRFKYYAFTQSSFVDFVNSIGRCTKEGPYTHSIIDGPRKLTIEKSTHQLTKIQLSIQKHKGIDMIVWDITVRDAELDEFYTRLKDIQNTILEANKTC